MQLTKQVSQSFGLFGIVDVASSSVTSFWSDMIMYSLEEVAISIC